MGDKFAIYRENDTGLVCIKQYFETGDIMGIIKIRPENIEALSSVLSEFK